MLRLTLPLALLVLVLDQATKQIILDWVMDPPRVIEVTGFFNLVLAFNRGVTFGLFSGEGGWQAFAFAALAVVISGALIYWVSRPGRRRLEAVCAGLIVGGAIGNAADRLFRARGAVVDFLDFHAFGWHWPAFNVADCGIVIGVLVLLADGLFERPPNGKTKRA